LLVGQALIRWLVSQLVIYEGNINMSVFVTLSLTIGPKYPISTNKQKHMYCVCVTTLNITFVNFWPRSWQNQVRGSSSSSSFSNRAL